jgi:zinc/manganese transport system substrate-binding protein
MKLRSFALLALAAFCAVPAAHAKVRVFACEPEWGALATELGGDLVEVTVATTALQDVHQIEAKPSLIAKVRRADLVACTGAELEAGWLPQLLRQAGNAKVASGPGHFLAASQVTTLEKPARLDRAAGDVHPEGNPHIQMDPYRMLKVARALSARLAQVDAGNANAYATRLAGFEGRWNAAIKRWEAKAAPLKGQRVVVQHNSWVYLTKWLGIEQVGSLEAKPGVPPTSAHLASMVDAVKAKKPFAVIRAAYQDPKASRWLSERTGVPAIALPFTVGADAKSQDLFALYDATIDALLGAEKK